MNEDSCQWMLTLDDNEVLPVIGQFGITLQLEAVQSHPKMD